jgi:ABC-type Zn2+ transport system substrate-binding protein/surface adhesin
VRGGHFEVVKYLVETGADINGLTHSDISPLQISIEHNGRNHEISKYLLGLGAEIPDEDEDEEHHDEGDHDEHDEDDDYEHDHEEDDDQTDDDEEDDDYDNVPSIVMIEEEIEAVLERTPEIVPAIVVDDDEEL